MRSAAPASCGPYSIDPEPRIDRHETRERKGAGALLTAALLFGEIEDGRGATPATQGERTNHARKLVSARDRWSDRAQPGRRRVRRRGRAPWLRRHRLGRQRRRWDRP